MANYFNLEEETRNKMHAIGKTAEDVDHVYILTYGHIKEKRMIAEGDSIDFDLLNFQYRNERFEFPVFGWIVFKDGTSIRRENNEWKHKTD